MKQKMNDLRIALQAHGHVQLPHNNTKADIRSLMKAWEKFCAQPLEHKQTLAMNIDGGYEYKGQESRDHKENFHVSAQYVAKTEHVFNAVDMNFLSKAQVFIRKNAYLIEEAIQLVCGDNFNEERLRREVKNATLRFLHYLPQEKEIIADPHVDKGITIHFAEDAPGLQILWKDKWINAEPMHGYILLYPGLIGQYYSRCRFPAVCHRVANTQETRERGRNSIVLFIDPGDVSYDKGTYGTTQENFPAGENYSIPFFRFKKYFIAREKALVF